MVTDFDLAPRRRTSTSFDAMGSGSRGHHSYTPLWPSVPCVPYGCRRPARWDARWDVPAFAGMRWSCRAVCLLRCVVPRAVLGAIIVRYSRYLVACGDGMSIVLPEFPSRKVTRA